MSMKPSAGADRMGTMPVGRLLISMAVPMMFSMMMTALYNVVDSIFVARLSEDALTAVSLAFPVQNMMISIAVGIGIGASALISRMLGMGEREKADHLAMQGYLLSTVSAALFIIIGLFFAAPFAKTQVDMNAPNGAAIAADCAIYLRIICAGGFGLFFTCLEEKLFASVGKTMYTMLLQVSGAIINIILDPIMIFGLLGCPAFGIAGAAYATIIGQIFGAVLGFVLMLTKNKDLTLRLKDMAPDWDKIKMILTISIPSILMSAVGSILTFILNIILITFSSTAVAVYGIYFKLQSFIFMPIFGLNSGMVPIIAYNYGAGNKERIHRTMRLSMLSAVAIMGLGMAAFNLIPTQLLGMFNASEDMLSIGVPALKTISLAFVTAGICIISGSVCQAFGYAFYSLFTSIARQIVVLLPAIYLLSLSGDVNMIWWAWPIAEVMSLVVSLFLLRRVFRKTGMGLKEA